jgi:hypothetical protein
VNRDKERSGPRLGTVAAVVVVGLLLVCALVAIILAFRGSDDESSSRPTVTVPPTASSGEDDRIGSTDPAAQGLGTPTTDPFGGRVDVPKWPGGWALPQTPVTRAPFNPAVPVESPAGMMWQRVGDGAIVPFSTSDGPATVTGLAATGFAQTPQGAALAGWQIVNRIGVSANEVAAGIYDTQVLMSAAMRSELEEGMAAQGPYYRNVTDASVGYMSRSPAFRVVEYADDLAVVEFAGRVPAADGGTDQWSVSRLVMVWDGGDWKVNLGNNTPLEAGTVGSLEGWTAW